MITFEEILLVGYRYRDDYEDKDPVSGSTDGLVKPAAPATSLYARPRTPPKIRRPVPLSEQDKYAYKTTAVQSTGTTFATFSSTFIHPLRSTFY